MRWLQRRKHEDSTSIVARNLGRAHGGADPKAVRATLRRDIERFNPDWLILTEAAPYYDIIERLPGYRQFQQKPPPHAPRGDDTGDVAVLLRDEHEVKVHWVARMSRFWKFRKYNVTHEPHRYEVVRAKVRGRVWRVRGSHWPTKGLQGPNGEAVLESAKKSKRWLLAGLLTPSADVGDLNEKRVILAGWYGERFAVYGSGIDVVVTRNVKSCEQLELPKEGSDHIGQHYRLWA